MKMIASLLVAGVLTTAAQTPPPDKPSEVSDPTSVRRDFRAGMLNRPTNRPVSGALVQAARVRNPLRLIDPRAPRELGNGYDNLAGSRGRGRVEGIKLFAINF